MKLNWIILFIFIYLFSSCGGGNVATGTGDGDPGSFISGIYVNQHTGSNLNGTGKKDHPYKTLSYALSKTTDISNKIYISPGTYSIETGENFPLILSKNVEIYKLYDNNNSDLIIKGAGNFENNLSIAMIFQGNNTIQDIIIDSNMNIGIFAFEDNNYINSCKLINNQVGISTIETANITINNTLITSNIYAIETLGNSIINLIQTSIYDNIIGIYTHDSSKINTVNQTINEIRQNTKCDFFNTSDQNIYLTNVLWDKIDITITKECKDGYDIVNKGLGNINSFYIPIKNTAENNTSNSLLSNNTLFKNSQYIKIISPSFNEIIYTNTPDIKYENTKSDKLIMITIWKHFPRVINGTIVLNDKNDIVWFWHTGMPMPNGSTLGYVKYNDGSTPINGDINPINNFAPPHPLQNGKSYFITIWEWDDEGIHVVASSDISYFSVAP